ncbi:MAG TPA: MFS transporter, partial [Amnibacterium sp.]|nr:MFS transporter [Amnibacterium sp.]
MLAPYRRILALPGALAFSGLGLFARMEMAMVGLGSVLLVQRTTGSYALGGAVAGTFGLASALASPAVARLADRFGQARLLRAAAPIHGLLLVAIAAGAVLGAPIAVVLVTAALAGVSQVSVGSLVRARWALIVGGRDLQVAFAFESVLDEVVFVVGPIVITLLAALVHPAVGLLLAAVTAVAGALLLARQGRTQPPIGDGSPHPEHDRGPVLRMRGMLVLVAVFLAAGGVFGSAEVAVAAVAKAAGVPAAAGVVLALWATGSMLGGLVYG